MAIELVQRRSANTKTFDLGNGRLGLYASIGDIHYKDNYADPGEAWKDIDLGWENNRIARAPYELTHEGKKITLRNKRTGAVATIELLDIGGKAVPDVAWERAKGLARSPGIALENVAVDTDLEIAAEFSAVRFRRILRSDKAPLEARFRISGDAPLRIQASDDGGDMPVEWSLQDYVLTETLHPDREVKYPVRIDPVWQVGASSDDCYRDLAPPAFGRTWTEVRAGSYTLSNYQMGSGMRFAGVAIPRRAIIDSAHLTLRATLGLIGGVVRTRISAERVDDAPTFANDPNVFDARWANRTVARVNWDGIGGWTSNNDYDTPDFKSVIQEVVDRADWASGNAMVLFWEDFENRTGPNNSASRHAYSYDGSTNYAPKLTIEWRELPPVRAPLSLADRMQAAGCL